MGQGATVLLEGSLADLVICLLTGFSEFGPVFLGHSGCACSFEAEKENELFRCWWLQLPAVLVSAPVSSFQKGKVLSLSCQRYGQRPGFGLM